jgi:hypothetical protein
MTILDCPALSDLAEAALQNWHHNISYSTLFPIPLKPKEINYKASYLCKNAIPADLKIPDFI